MACIWTCVPTSGHRCKPEFLRGLGRTVQDTRMDIRIIAPTDRGSPVSLSINRQSDYQGVKSWLFHPFLSNGVLRRCPGTDGEMGIIDGFHVAIASLGIRGKAVVVVVLGFMWNILCGLRVVWWQSWPLGQAHQWWPFLQSCRAVERMLIWRTKKTKSTQLLVSSGGLPPGADQNDLGCWKERWREDRRRKRIGRDDAGFNITVPCVHHTCPRDIQTGDGWVRVRVYWGRDLVKNNKSACRNGHDQEGSWPKREGGGDTRHTDKG